jgi:hypothetical protein
MATPADTTLYGIMKDTSLSIPERLERLAETSEGVVSDGRSMNISGYIDALEVIIDHPPELSVEEALHSDHEERARFADQLLLRNLYVKLIMGRGQEEYDTLNHAGFFDIATQYFPDIAK